MRKEFLFSMASLMVAFAVPAQAVGPATGNLVFGTPTLSGSGCPRGSAGVSLSPDSLAFSVIFDSYSVEAGRSLAGTPEFASKQCMITVPVKVPAGYMIADLSADYRGDRSVLYPSLAAFEFGEALVEKRSASVPTRAVRLFTDQNDAQALPDEGDFQVTRRQAPIKVKGCGGQAYFKLFSRVSVIAPRRRSASQPSQPELIFAQLDSVDGRSEVSARYNLVKCP